MRDKVLAFFRRRWAIITALIAAVWTLAFGGLLLSAQIPYLGTFLFLAVLMVWYVPGVLFHWTGLFEYHEFGASPTGAGGYVVMFLFYFALACLIAAPFGRRSGK